MGQGFPRTSHWQTPRLSIPQLPKVVAVTARWAAGLAVLSLLAIVAIVVALQVTPLQTVNVAGQIIKVGSTAPGLTFSGPGEIDMFGQSLPTNLQFTGPVRPRLQLAQISINSELTNFVEGSKPSRVEHILGSRLAGGWAHYFIWESVIAGAGVLILVGALAGWRRVPHRTTIKLLAAGLIIAEVINVAAILVTANRAQAALRQVSSLNQLVGSAPLKPPKLGRKQPGVPVGGVQAVVLGDSTAAGAGLPPVSGGTSFDRACGRSSDAYAEDLASVNSWHVLNLSCSGATIKHGILGPQHRDGQTFRPQLATAQRVKGANVVIVSIGANDLGWAQMLGLCAAAPSCDDKATTAYFQQQLASFSKEYLDLLSRLAALPSHPSVIINRYYDPFGSDPACLREVGYTPDKLVAVTDRLNALNTVLQKGAAQFGFSSPQPDFAGHQLCSTQPYVQGLAAPAAFHPTALGQLAIALADQAALHS